MKAATITTTSCRSPIGSGLLRSACLRIVLVIGSLCALGCRGQQSPFREVQRFQEGIEERTNVCGRQKLVYLDNVTVADSLRGLNLTVALTRYTEPYEDEFFNLDANGRIPERNPGLFVVLLDELAERAGFFWRDSFVAVDAVDEHNPVVNSTKTQSDLLEWQVNAFDISVDNWAKTVNRLRRGIAFPEGWFDSSLVLIERSNPDAQEVNMWSFLTPFTVPVWIMIAVAIFVTGILYWSMERLNSNADSADLEGKPMTTVFLSALTFTGNFSFQPNTHAARILAFSWTFWTLVVASSYTANLASFLVARRTPDFQIRSIEQAVRFNVPICIHGASNQDELLNESFADIMLVRKRVEREVYEGLLAGECRVAVASVNSYEMYARSNVNKDCSLISDKRVIEILSGGFATAIDSGTLCTSLIDAVIDLYMTQMKADGFIEKVWNTHLQRVGDVSCLAEAGSIVGEGVGALTGGNDEDTVSLTLEEMGGIFILHGICASIALVLALVRFFLVKKKHPQELVERLGLEETMERLGLGNDEDEDDVETEDTAAADSDLRTSLHIAGPNEFWEKQKQKQKRRELVGNRDLEA